MKKKTPQSRNASDVEMCTCANLRKATRAITQAYDTALRPAGLKSTQFSLLATLIKCGDIPLTQLAETLGMDRTTLTRNLQPLIRRKLIAIEHEEDLRVRNICLTDTGRKVFEQALPGWEKIQLQVSQNLGKKQWAGLLDALAATTLAIQNN